MDEASPPVGDYLEMGLERWHRFLSPEAITVVGASPSVPSSEGLLRNLRREEMPFDRPIHVVNPNRREVCGIPCVKSLAEVDGPVGVVFLFVPSETCLDVLNLLPRSAAGAVIFSGGFAETGNFAGHRRLAAWSRARGVPVLGPQSLGFVSMPHQIIATTAPIPETFVAGRVGLVMQSGGLLDGTLRSLMQSGLGVSLAMSCGTGSAVGFAELGAVCLRDPDTAVLAMYVESIRSSSELVELARVAKAEEKPVVLLLGGASPLGEKASRSHTGARATPWNLAKGIAEQHGFIRVDDQSELIWTLEALTASAFARPGPGGVAVYTHSAGAGIAIADAASRTGLPLGKLSAATVTALGASDVVDNPFDAGPASLFDQSVAELQIRALASDPGIAIVARAAGIGLPEDGLPWHVASASAFVSEVQLASKVPVLCSVIFQDTAAVPKWPGVPIAAGAREAAVKLRGLWRWANQDLDHIGDDSGPAGGEHFDSFVLNVPVAGPAADSVVVLTGEVVRRMFAGTPLSWPRQKMVDSASEALAAAKEIGFPIVVKAECGLAHRANVGGVLTGVRSEGVLCDAARYLISKFGTPISINAEVEHEAGFILGVERTPEHGLILALGDIQDRGAADPDFMVFPITKRQLAQTAARYSLARSEDLWRIADRIHALFVGDARLETIEFNPLVVAKPTGDLMALDAKAHLRPRPARDPAQRR